MKETETLSVVLFEIIIDMKLAEDKQDHVTIEEGNIKLLEDQSGHVTIEEEGWRGSARFSRGGVNITFLDSSVQAGSE